MASNEVDTTRDTNTKVVERGDGTEVEVAQDGPRLVVPELDGEGGTTFVYGGTDEEADPEEWNEQNGKPANAEDDDLYVDEREDKSV